METEETPPGWQELDATAADLTELFAYADGSVLLRRTQQARYSDLLLSARAVARLRAFLGAASAPVPLPLEAMATVLSASGWLVREYGLTDDELRRIAAQHGYVLTPYEPATAPPGRVEP